MNNQDFYEINFEGFGYREIRETAELFKAYLDSNIHIDGLKVCFNANSGNVFLSDENYRVWMDYNGKLKEFFSCPNCGWEGYIEEFERRTKDECNECVELYENNKGLDENE